MLHSTMIARTDKYNSHYRVSTIASLIVYNAYDNLDTRG